ncbi:MAG: hypothetical protein Kow0059_09630 [Candidatus Sumerlaeia bacterium]
MLLEVMVSLIILAITLGTSLRAFTHSLASLRRIETTTTGLFLADQFLTEAELIPAREGSYEGNFGDLFPHYYWTLTVERRDIEYEELEFEGDLDEFEPLFWYDLRIYYDNGRQKPFKVIDAESYMLGAELFSVQSKQEMQIF